MSPWHTVETAAEVTRRSQWTIRSWARKGRVRTLRFEGRVFVHAGDVAALSASAEWVDGDPLMVCGA